MAPQVPPYPNALRACIKQAGYSFREVSKETGIPESTLYDWAAGKRPIPHHERKILAALLGCSVEALTPKQASNASIRVETPDMLQSYYESAPPQAQQGDDMNTKRRLILLRAMSVAGIAFVTPLEPLLDAEPWTRMAQATTKPSSVDPAVLMHFEKLNEACWHMSNGSELATVEQLLPMYLPQLSILAQQASTYQPIAAGIASQGHLLSYVVASHQENFQLALDHCKQARMYGQIAQNRNLEAVALIRQGVVGLHRRRPYQALEAFEEARKFIDEVSPLLRARLYANLGEVQGKLRMEQVARRSIGLAQENFPDYPENDLVSLYLSFSKSGLYLHEGLALLDLQRPIEALDALLQIDGLHPKMDISERSRIDVLNQQALAAGTKGDLEQFRLYLEAAVTSAVKIGSDLRYSEAWEMYRRVQDMWSREPQVRNLRSLFTR